MNGQGQYTSPATGTIRFTMQSLAYIANGGCDYPIGGRITLSAGGDTAIVNFDTGTCGTASLTIGGSTQVIDLTEIDFNPCR